MIQRVQKLFLTSTIVLFAGTVLGMEGSNYTPEQLLKEWSLEKIENEEKAGSVDKKTASLKTQSLGFVVTISDFSSTVKRIEEKNPSLSTIITSEENETLETAQQELTNNFYSKDISFVPIGSQVVLAFNVFYSINERIKSNESIRKESRKQIAKEARDMAETTLCILDKLRLSLPEEHITAFNELVKKAKIMCSDS
jgi:hypothetical protein